MASRHQYRRELYLYLSFNPHLLQFYSGFKLIFKLEWDRTMFKSWSSLTVWNFGQVNLLLWTCFSFFFKFFIYYLFLAVLGLRFCARAFSSCGKWGPLFIAVRGPLTVVASLVVEHRLQTRRLSRCGSRAQLLRGMWDLPRPGLEPVSPALAGGFSTTVPPGKPWTCFSYR